MNNFSRLIIIGFAATIIVVGVTGLLFTFAWNFIGTATNNFAPYGMMNGYSYQNITPVPNQNYGYGMMGGGMTGGYYNQYAPTAVPTQTGATPAAVEQEIKITADDLRFNPPRITVKAGSTVRFVITNNDAVPHNFVSQPANIPYLALPVNTTQTLVWTAPTREGTYTALCTLHPGMILQIAVTK